MALETPATQTLADSIRSQISAEISQTIPLLPKAFTFVLAKVLAAVVILLFKYAGSVFLNMFVATASDKETTINGVKLIPVVEWGRQIGVGDPLPATVAELNLTVTVRSQTGSILAGAQVQHKPTGIVYVVKAAVPLDAATVTVRVRAASGPPGDDGIITDGSGDIGNRQVGDELDFANPLANIARTATVASIAVTASDKETTAAYRARVLRRNQARAQGGALADYQEWAEGVAGILHGYPYTSSTPGEVDVYVEATVASSGSADGIPTSDQLTAVAAAINLDTDGLATRRPVTAAANVFAITRKSFNLTVTGLDADDTDAAEEAIEDAVDEYLRTLEPFIVGLSVLPRADRVTQGGVAGVVNDAASGVGATVSNVELYVGLDLITAYTLANGEKAKLGTPTFA